MRNRIIVLRNLVEMVLCVHRSGTLISALVLLVLQDPLAKRIKTNVNRNHAFTENATTLTAVIRKSLNFFFLVLFRVQVERDD